jgi:hypothetical protein
LIASSISRAIAIVAFLSAPLGAQRPDINVTGRFGIAAPADDYQSNCGHSSLAVSLDVQRQGRVFPHLSLDHFTGSGGGDVLCVSFEPTVGGLRLEGATRLGLGMGARVGSKWAHLEGVLQGGLITGRPGYESAGVNHGREVLPHVGGQLTAVLARYVVISYARHLTRLSRDVFPADGGSVRTSQAWSPLVTLQFGVRVPL